MKKIILTIVVVILCLGAVGGSIFGILKLTDTGKFDTKKISNTSFSVGGLDSNGKYMNTNASIYTKEAFECQGFEVNLDFDNEVEYQIYFYDQNNDFVHTTGKLSGAFVKDSVPFFAKYARIVVTPKNDDVVSKLEVNKYAKQLTVKVNREQGFKNYTENLFSIAKTGTGIVYSTGEESTEVENAANMVVTNYVDVSAYKDALVFKTDRTMLVSTPLFLYDANKTWVKSVNISSVATCFESSTGFYYSIDLSKISGKEYTYVRTSMLQDTPVEFYCR